MFKFSLCWLECPLWGSIKNYLYIMYRTVLECIILIVPLGGAHFTHRNWFEQLAESAGLNQFRRIHEYFLTEVKRLQWQILNVPY